MNTLTRIGLGLLCAATLLIAPPRPALASAPSAEPLVAAPAGAVRGRAGAGAGVAVFKGIPYAAPPIGARRWRPPAPAARWKGVREADRFGAACIQPTPRGTSLYSDDIGPTSEDCLSLNIWTPSVRGRAPVIVWIHGGALIGGASRSSLFDGARMAATGTVVVTLNYRLGILGYFSHPDLSRESPDGVSGNYGLLDQIEALQWVRRNIAAFGGDPGNVTIAGESAGALSVMYLMASPRARGLFGKAISESAYMAPLPLLRAPVFGAPAAESVGVYLGGVLHAPTLAALRAMDPQALTDQAFAAHFVPFGVVDGVILPEQLVDAFDHGRQAGVPILAGFNSGEVRSQRVLAPPTPASAQDYERAIRERYGDLAGDFLALYPASDMGESILATTRDAIYGWTAERLVRSQARAGHPSFLYLFDHGYPGADGEALRAFHGSEQPFVFGTLEQTPALWPRPPATAGERRLSDAMIAYWTSFARTGRPHGAGLPAWSAFAPGGAYMRFDEGPVAARNLMPGMFALHERSLCRRRAAGLGWMWNVGLASPVLAGATPACP